MFEAQLAIGMAYRSIFAKKAVRLGYDIEMRDEKKRIIRMVSGISRGS